MATGLLYCWGYRAAATATVVIPAAVVVELALYLLVASRRLRRVAYWAPPVGLLARAAMAAGSAVTWPAAASFGASFLVYFGSNWPGVILQMLLAAFAVWFIADMVAGPVPVLADQPAEQRPARERPRRSLLQELLPEDARGPQAGEPDRAPVIPERPRPAPEVAKPATQGASEPPPAEPPVIEAPQETEADIVDTSELPPVRETAEVPAEAPSAAQPAEPAAVAADARELVAAAVAQAVEAATGLAGFRVISAGDELAVVANLPERADPNATASCCWAMAAAAGQMGEAGLLGTPHAIALLMRAGGAYLVAGEQSVVLVNLGAVGTLGEIVAAARRLSGRLNAPWPEKLPVQLPAASAAEAVTDAVAEWARAAAQQVAWHSVDGCGLVATVASAGAVHQPLAAAAGLMWQAAADLGRILAAGGPKSIVILFGAGAAAIGAARVEPGGSFVVLRASASARAGLVAAELDRIIELCEKS